MTDAASTTAESQSEDRPLVFISHRHADKEIADVIRSFVIGRSGGRVEVFQSSEAAGATGPRPGLSLRSELVSNLWRASVVVLVYTTEDKDWSFCMWECGVATRPGSPDTRIILFQCGRKSPSIFEDQVRVVVTSPTDVHRFTSDLMTSDDFFPQYRRPICPGFQPDSPFVESAARELFDALQRVLPQGNDVAEWPPYPYVKLKLDAAHVERVKSEEPGSRLAATCEVLESAVVVDADREAARIFGMPDIPPATAFGELIHAWRDRFPNAEPRWLEGLSTQVMDAAQWQFPSLRWELMRGMDRNDGAWYAPVLNFVRRREGAMEFDVYFDKFNVDPATNSVEIGRASCRERV